MNGTLFDRLIDDALIEDAANTDVTSEALIPENEVGSATIKAKSDGILAGVKVAGRVFFKIDPQLKVTILLKDGTLLKSGDAIAKVEGKVTSILKAERTVLNFLQHLSGIASETSRYVQAVHDLPVKIIDTRKTIPGLRVMQKYAVKTGGGGNHRMDLKDGILIKDNHLKILRSQGLTIKGVIARAREHNRQELKIEIEVKTVAEVEEAVQAGADIIMLDNMSIEEMKKAVELVAGRCLVEASGGVNLDTVRAIAETGVDFISVGALTHSPKALDINMKLD
jgi:nicotinate-nucleotide pyrophosphorylase (carboxylating)